MNEEAQKPVVNLPAKDLPIEPITLHEVEEEIQKRVSLIDKEFNRGFDFIKDQPKTVTFFGSSRFTEDNEHYQTARRLAHRLSSLGYSIVTGGGPGIMEGANRGAFEAEGRSLGLTIKLANEQVRNPYLTDTVEFYYFFTRKVMLSFSAEAYVFFPGGLGTFDELFEILTLVQTNKIEKVPVILIGGEFWKALDSFMHEQMFAKNKAIDETDIQLYTIVDNEDEIVKIIQEVPIRVGVRFNHSRYGESPE
ncbi:TIGR00730 family Rossman fold protein [Candidatus Parcubacteria bacterium]|nr:TIGR00730 family Rossman fold protein [Candidatus Parcubacteria bacterium]